MTATQFPSVTETTAPTVTPLTVAQCRPMMRLPSTETGHDDELESLLKAARDKLQDDTGITLINTTYTQEQPCFDEPIQLTRRPVSSITSIKYYDTANSQQTLSTDVYELDTQRQQIVLKPDQVYPAIYDRWDAIEIIYVAGYGAAATDVKAVFQRMLILLMRYDFDGDDFHLTAYESLLGNYLRHSYP